MYNVIGDIAGNYKTLMALIEKMPKCTIVAVGDIIDRGPRSREVVEYFMKTPDTKVLMGNHEHMMLDYIDQKNGHTANPAYESDIWFYNGGLATAESYNHNIPNDVVEFLRSRPIDLKLDIDGKMYYISHAFLPFNRDADEKDPDAIFQKLWNRQHPFFNAESPDIQICGHNSQFGMRYWTDPNTRKKAICIDTSRSEVLTGIHLPTLTIYQQEYID